MRGPRFAAGLALALSPAVLFAATLSPPRAADPARRARRAGAEIREGRYHNCGYGYSFRIPKGLVAEGAPDGVPQHGVRISLGRRPDRHIRVDGSFDPLLWKSLDEAAEHHSGVLREGGRAAVVLRRRSTRLRRLRARRLTASPEAGGGGAAVDDTVVALRKSSREPDVIYTLSLTTTKSMYVRDRRLLDAVLRTWRFEPLPCESRRRP